MYTALLTVGTLGWKSKIPHLLFTAAIYKYDTRTSAITFKNTVCTVALLAYILEDQLGPW